MSAEKYEPGSDVEGGSPKAAPNVYLATTDDRYHFDQSDLDRVQRRLKQRHVQMFVSFAYTLL